VEMPSWRGNVRASALNGFAALGDKRALDLGLRFAAMGNPSQVRAASLRLLGNLGKNDPRVFPIVADAIADAFNRRDFTTGVAAAEALVSLADPRGLAILDTLLKDAEGSPQIHGILMQFQSQLRRVAAGGVPADAHP